MQRSEAGRGVSRFRALALLTTATTYALIVLGGVVRTTESGDACPDWPRCHGELIPPLESAVLIEFSHRLVASLVGLLVLATMIAAWRWQRGRPLVVWGATAALALVCGQIVLGGMTVLSDLPSSMVMAHLALASALLATLLGVTMLSFRVEPRATPERRERAASFRNQALVAALAVFAVMLTGSYVSGSGASLAFSDWPLFDGSLLPDGGRLAMIHATHRLAVVVVGLFTLHVAAKAMRTMPGERTIGWGSIAVVGLYVAQVFVGAANIWTLLQPAASTAHLALAVAIWGLLAGMTLYAHLLSQPAREALAEREERAPLAAPGAVAARGQS